METVFSFNDLLHRQYSCFVVFRVTDKERFMVLARVFEILKQAKQTLLVQGESHEMIEQLIDMLFDLLDDQVLSHFWWPSRQQRLTDVALKHPWDFEAMVESFMNGDYELVACSNYVSDVGIFEFFPYGFPYGDTESMKALIRAFDFIVTGEDDGTGYVSLL